MDADRIEIHTDPLNQNLMGKLDQMRPKADPIPLAKSRALVIGTGAAGIALIIAACAMTWGYVQENKRAETAQDAQIEANKEKAIADAKIAKIRALAQADVEKERTKAEVAMAVPGADGKLPPVGNTVDVANANWTNTIGAAELGAVWTDPDFDASQSAFYYVRVLEIPTPPWYLYDAFRFGVEIPKDAPTSQQERAYTTPIWYTPEG
jgi:hypothetical protein